MLKQFMGVMAGYLVWTVVFLGGSTLLRSAMAGVHDAEGLTRDPLALVLYLVLSFAASFLAGRTTARLAGAVRPVFILAGLLLATGIPVQIGSWDQLPVWYHLIFLGMLVPMTLAGGRGGELR
jgi:hypothetical protein